MRNRAPYWLNYFPASLRAKFEHRQNLQRALINLGWLIGDKAIRMGVGLLVGVWVARYLGPEQFGLLNYGIAIVTMLGALTGLGLNGIVVRDLVQKPSEKGTTLGTTFLLQLIAGALTFTMAIIAISILKPTDDLAKIIVAILGLSLVFRASDAVKYWFESQVKSKYTVWTETSVFLVLAAARIGLILAHAPLLAFAYITLAEAALAAIFLILIYTKTENPRTRWRASITRARSLLLESWPLILASAASLMNMRMDQVLLGTMTSNSVVGSYSAAVRLAEAWLIAPTIIGSTIYPSIVAAKEKSEEIYRKRILKITAVMSLVTIPAAILISLLSPQITNLIYGHQYKTASSYLAIYIWSGVPYLIFFALNHMFYTERMLKLSLAVSIFAVTSNLCLNLTLIPVYGGLGAAISTLITSIGATLLSIYIINKKTGIFLKFRKTGP